jgi:hypothetical protein
MAINKLIVLYVLVFICHLALASESYTFQVISCPGDVLTTECAIMGRGATIWQGTAFQCGIGIHDYIVLRHSQFEGSYNPIRTCNNGALVTQALGIVNDRYISQLNVTVSPELNNLTVECWHNFNLTDTVIKQIQIIVIAIGECRTANA